MTRDEFFAFVWSGQSGFPEVAPDDLSRRQCVASLAAAESFPGLVYAAPILRKQRGGRKEHVADQANVLWLDCDVVVAKSEIAPSWMRDQLLAHLEEVFGRAGGGLSPSLLVDSGNRGFHAYWKLYRPIPTRGENSLEALLRRLVCVVNAGGVPEVFKADSCVDCNRLLRVPGALNTVSGRYAEVISASEQTYEPEEILARLAELERTFAIRAPSRPRPRAPTRHARGELPLPPPILSQAQGRYLEIRPGKAEGYDRSKWEYGIAAALIKQGWSDSQIRHYAITNQFPRALEEIEKGRAGWIDRCIARARGSILDNDELVTSPQGGPTYFEDEPETLFPVGRVPRRSTHKIVDRAEVLPFTIGISPTAAVRAIEEKTGCNERTGWRILTQAETSGYITKEPHPTDGRKKIIQATEKMIDTYELEPFGQGHLRRWRNTLRLQSLKGMADGTERTSSWIVKRNISIPTNSSE